MNQRWEEEKRTHWKRIRTAKKKKKRNSRNRKSVGRTKKKKKKLLRCNLRLVPAIVCSLYRRITQEKSHDVSRSPDLFHKSSFYTRCMWYFFFVDTIGFCLHQMRIKRFFFLWVDRRSTPIFFDIKCIGGFIGLQWSFQWVFMYKNKVNNFRLMSVLEALFAFRFVIEFRVNEVKIAIVYIKMEKYKKNLVC